MQVRSLLGAALAAAIVNLGGPASANPITEIPLSQEHEISGLRLTLHEVVTLRPEAAFTDILLADPGMIDFAARDDGSLLVMGKMPGRTSLALLDAAGDLTSSIPLEIHADLAGFTQRLERALPASGIEVQSANFGIVLSGTVSSTDDLATALTLAEHFAPGRVTDLIQLRSPEPVDLQVEQAEIDAEVLVSLRSSSTIHGTQQGSDLAVLSLGATPERAARLLSSLEAKGLLQRGETQELNLMTGESSAAQLPNVPLELHPRLAAGGGVIMGLGLVDSPKTAEFAVTKGHSVAVTLAPATTEAPAVPVLIVTPAGRSAAVTRMGHVPAGTLRPGAIDPDPNAALQN